MAADHMADMVLRHFVISQIQRRITVFGQLFDQFGRFAAVNHLNTDKNVGLARIVVAVIELGDVALADQPEKFLVGARLLRQRHRQHRFAPLADFGPFGDKAQTVEIHVGAGRNGDQGLVLQLVLADIFLGTGHCKRPCWFENRTGVLENILDCRADGIGIDQDHFIDVFLAQPESFFADKLDRRTVSKQANLLQTHTVALGQRLRHRIGVLGLDTDDLDFRPQALDVSRHTGDQPTAAHTTENSVDRPAVARMLAQDFHRNRALPGDHFRIIEGMNEGQLLGFFQFQRMRVGIVIRIAEEHHFATTAFDSINLDARRRRRHHNHRPATHLGRRERNALRMIARRSADHATLELFGGKTGDLVISATQLEGENRLQILALQQNLVAEPCRKVAGQVERRFDGHIVNLCVENFFEIIRVHGAIL